ncbi:ankyrin repeat domain-containing protein [Roseivirga pacifica]
MKNQVIKSTRLLAATLIMLVALSACGQKNSGTEEGGKAATTAKVKAPKISIHDAVISGNSEALQQHIDARTDLNKKDPFGGSSPLIIATVFDKTEMALTLIKAGANLNMKNNEGSTALHTAAFFCRLDILKALIDAGADQSIKNNFNTTAYESVVIPFDQVEPVYKMMGQQLAPMGLTLDMARIEKSRPEVAKMLK